METGAFDHLSAADKNAIVSAYLDNPAERQVIAASLANPIRRDMNYQGVARKSLVVDVIPQGELSIYDIDVRVPAKVMGRRGRVEDAVLEGERVTVPTFTVASYPQVHIEEVQYRKYNIVDRAQQRAKNDLIATEDTLFFNTLENAANSGANTPATSAGYVTKNALLDCYTQVLRWQLTPSKFLMNPVNYVDLLRFQSTDIDPVTMREQLMTGLWGHIFTCDIVVSYLIPVNRIYCVAEPEQTGVMPIRQDITVTPSDVMPQFKLGWLVYEIIGFGVLNARAVNSIQVTGKTQYTPWYLSTNVGEPIFTPNGTVGTGNFSF